MLKKVKIISNDTGELITVNSDKVCRRYMRNGQMYSELNYDKKYQQALQSIRSIAEECLVSSKIPPEKIESIINECSEALNE